MKTATLLVLFATLCTFESRGAQPPSRRAQQLKPPLEAPAEKPAEEIPVRQARPLTLSASGVGKTPFFGVLVDMNLHPHVGLGAGYGYFSVQGATGSFIPVFLHFYPLKGNFSPFLEGGVDFVTVKFTSTNTLLNSTFRGTQFIVGGGLEYRFDFGLMARLDAMRFINAKIWSPGLAIGYSVSIFEQ